MTPEQFVYWLQGFYEISGNELAPTSRDIIIRDHLKEVFNKKTPDYYGLRPNIAPALPNTMPNCGTTPTPNNPQQGQIIC